MNKCKSYTGGICKDGFPMNYPPSSACTGNSCRCCGKHNDVIPHCQNEDIRVTWINDDGSPKHYKGIMNG